MSTLVIAEHDNKKLSLSTLSILSAAQQLDAPCDILCAGFNCEAVAEELIKLGCADTILHADSPNLEHFIAESISSLISELSKNYTHVLAPATSFGKNILPRAAAQSDMAQISDVCKIIDKNTYQRPIYAANALSSVKSNEPIQFITIRSTAFPPIAPQGKASVIKKIETDIKNNLSRFVKAELKSQDRPSLTSAKIVISGGRGLGDKSTFERLDKIAERMGAALGASRAAVDAGLVPNDLQVGQTGQIVAPELYIAVGISGAIQHIAGMKDSKIIIAINKDPEAPIFEIADYALVCDLHKALDDWESALAQVLGQH
jgi:electron transfer flavoprotein alpha subunit